MVTEQQTDTWEAYRKVMASHAGHMDEETMDGDVKTLIACVRLERYQGPTADATPMQDWVAQALDKMQPILDGSELTGRYFEVEKESMRDILDRVEWLVDHFKVMPEPCNQNHSEIFKAGGIAVLQAVEERMNEEGL